MIAEEGWECVLGAVMEEGAAQPGEPESASPAASDSDSPSSCAEGFQVVPLVEVLFVPERGGDCLRKRFSRPPTYATMWRAARTRLATGGSAGEMWMDGERLSPATATEKVQEALGRRTGDRSGGLLRLVVEVRAAWAGRGEGPQQESQEPLQEQQEQQEPLHEQQAPQPPSPFELHDDAQRRDDDKHQPEDREDPDEESPPQRRPRLLPQEWRPEGPEERPERGPWQEEPRQEPKEVQREEETLERQQPQQEPQEEPVALSPLLSSAAEPAPDGLGASADVLGGDALGFCPQVSTGALIQLDDGSDEELDSAAAGQDEIDRRPPAGTPQRLAFFLVLLACALAAFWLGAVVDRWRCRDATETQRADAGHPSERAERFVEERVVDEERRSSESDGQDEHQGRDDCDDPDVQDMVEDDEGPPPHIDQTGKDKNSYLLYNLTLEDDEDADDDVEEDEDEGDQEDSEYAARGIEKEAAMRVVNNTKAVMLQSLLTKVRAKFDPASPLVSYVDHGGCGPRGDDARANTSSCLLGVKEVMSVPIFDYKVVASVAGCDYYAYTVFECKSAHAMDKTKDVSQPVSESMVDEPAACASCQWLAVALQKELRWDSRFELAWSECSACRLGLGKSVAEGGLSNHSPKLAAPSGSSPGPLLLPAPERSPIQLIAQAVLTGLDEPAGSPPLWPALVRAALAKYHRGGPAVPSAMENAAVPKPLPMSLMVPVAPRVTSTKTPSPSKEQAIAKGTADFQSSKWIEAARYIIEALSSGHKSPSNEDAVNNLSAIFELRGDPCYRLNVTEAQRLLSEDAWIFAFFGEAGKKLAPDAALHRAQWPPAVVRKSLGLNSGHLVRTFLAGNSGRPAYHPRFPAVSGPRAKEWRGFDLASLVAHWTRSLPTPPKRLAAALMVALQTRCEEVTAAEGRGATTSRDLLPLTV